MAYTGITRNVNYVVGPASTGPFDIPFSFSDEDEVVVYVNGNPVGGYNVMGIDNVSFSTPYVEFENPISNCVVSVVSMTPSERASGSIMTLATVSEEFDRIYQVLQEVRAFGAFQDPEGKFVDLGSRRLKASPAVDADDVLTLGSGSQLEQVAQEAIDRYNATSASVTAAANSAQAAQERLDRLQAMGFTVVEIGPDETQTADYDAASNVMTFHIPRGPQGPVGPIGLTGPTGPQGPQGPQGPVGPVGLTGPAGAQGLQGETGAVGPQGPQGPQGIQGETGVTGPQGPQGPQGVQGPTGPNGGVGPTGPTGNKGPTGDKGLQGDVGPAGPTGPQGPMGSTPMGLAFGQISIDADGKLTLEYYGDADANDFRIDADGNLYVTV